MTTNQHLITLSPAYPLNAANVEPFRQSIYEAIKSHRGHDVLINLEQVDLIDSAVVVALVQVTKYANSCGKRLGLCRVNSQVRMVLELTQMDRFVSMVADETEFLYGAVQLMAA